ncbi:MAG: hypothetical protein AB1509_09160 [Chloroflexota bacterium]
MMRNIGFPKHPTSALNTWNSCGESIMDLRLPPDFKEFLKLLKEYDVRYLLIGGYAVGYHGYPRTTDDLDIWIAVHPDNANRLVAVMKSFGLEDPNLTPDLFLQKPKIIRMGFPPMRLDIATEISGVDFEDCYQARIVDQVDGVEVNLIDLDNLKKNKRASGRTKDIADLEKLP